MFESFQVERMNLSNKIVDHFKTLIQEERLKPGEQLPPERELSELLNVSRNSIREGYKILEALGFIQIKHGQGVFVSHEEENIRTLASQFFIKNDQFQDLFEIRKVLETYGVQLAGQRAKQEQLDQLFFFTKQTFISICERKIQNNELGSLDQKFHQQIAALSKNKVLARIMLNLTDLLKNLRAETARLDGRMEKSWQEHLFIVEALKEKNVPLAQNYMLQHLQSVENSLSKGESVHGG